MSFSDADRLDAWQDVRLDGNGSHFLYPADVTDINGASFPVLIIKKNILGDPEKPSVEYLDHIVSGARFHSLPSAYVEKLKSIPARKAGFPVPAQSTFDRSVLAGLSCDCGAAESAM